MKEFLREIIDMVMIVVLIIVLVFVADSMGMEAQAQITIKEPGWLSLAVKYWWNILSLVIAPVGGFVVGQYYKALRRRRPSTVEIGGVAGVATCALAGWLWPGSISESIKIGVLIGTIQPFIVYAWFAAAEKFFPKQAEGLKGADGKITILPWIKIRHD